MGEPVIQHFYDPPTGTLSYVVADPVTSSAAVIDPVLGYNSVSGRTDTSGADEIAACIGSRGLELQWILETHAHADHLTAAQYLKGKLGGHVAIGEGICDVQQHFQSVFNLKSPFSADGHQFDHLFSDGERFNLGDIECRVLATPGHTDDSVTYLIGNAAFVGDSLFMTDFGTARCDFPGGDAGRLFDSIQRLFALPDDTRLYMCHDYPPDSRELCFETTVSAQKADNIHVGQAATRAEFVGMRIVRDATLSLPALILPAIQVNIQAGKLPESDDNGVSYIRIPLNRL